MIPQSDKRNEPTKRTLLACGLLLALVNLGATPGSLRLVHGPRAAKRAAIERVCRAGPPAGLLTGERSASTDPATALQVVPTPAAWPKRNWQSTSASSVSDASLSVTWGPATDGIRWWCES